MAINFEDKGENKPGDLKREPAEVEKATSAAINTPSQSFSPGDETPPLPFAKPVKAEKKRKAKRPT